MTESNSAQREPIRIVIADDQELIRAGLAMVINSQPDLQVIGQANDGAQAIALADTLRPDVMLMDVRMPNVDGIEATRQIIREYGLTDGSTKSANQTEPGNEHPLRIIILTTFDLDEYVMAGLEAGASGFLLKDAEPEELLKGIRTVYEGNAIIAPTATKRLIEHVVESREPAAAVNRASAAEHKSLQPESQPYTDPELDLLTDREREVLIELAHALSNQEIADKLFISLPTVKTHVAHILEKIHARDRAQAMLFAYENHLLD